MQKDTDNNTERKPTWGEHLEIRSTRPDNRDVMILLNGQPLRFCLSLRIDLHQDESVATITLAIGQLDVDAQVLLELNAQYDKHSEA